MRYKKKPPVEKECLCCKTIFLPKINHPSYRYCTTVCKDKFLKQTEQYKEAQRNRSNLYNNKNRDSVRQRHLTRYYKNKEYFFAKNVERRARKILAHPGWEEELTIFVLNEAVSLRTARNQLTGILWHIDHQIPLHGKEVCGLHVWNNFQVIPASVNLRKGNRNSVHDKWQERL